jgi:hypothetical protein
MVPRFVTDHQRLKRDQKAVTGSLTWNPVEQSCPGVTQVKIW